MPFEITVAPADAGHQVETQWRRPGEPMPIVSRAPLKLDREALPGAIRSREDALSYGRLLSDALFGEPIAREFRAACEAYRAASLHVSLGIESNALRELRWELLTLPGESTFFRMNQATPFSVRVLSDAGRPYPPAASADLTALAIVVDHGNDARWGLAPFDAEATAGSIVASLRPIPCLTLACSGEVRLPAAAALPTLDAIAEYVSIESPIILHVCCHGRRTPQGESFLFLRRSDNASRDSRNDTVDPVTADRFVNALQNLKSLPRLVFLCSCETAFAGTSDALDGFALRLVRELGIPAVVAMTEPLPISVGQRFSTLFYERLRGHGLIDLALSEASAGFPGNRHILIPTLYTRLAVPALFEQTIAAPVWPTLRAAPAVDRERVIEFLCSVSEGSFTRLCTSLPGARKHIPPGGSRFQQVAALMDFAEAADGPGLSEIVRLIEKLWPGKLEGP